MPQACGIGRGERRTPTDWVGRNARRSPSQVSSGRSDQLQPQDRCPGGEGPTSTSTAGRGPRTKDQGQLRRFGPRCLRRTNVKLRSGSIPSWATLWSTRATGITHPGFYGRKPWRKPNNASIITAAGTRCEGSTRVVARIVHFSYRKLQQKFTFSAGNTRHWPPVTSATVRR